jgi:glutathione synthase/RimK-type ligase-like ATP-grasp enzyme
MILILTHEDDEHAEAVCSALTRSKRAFYVFRTADFPQKLKVTIPYNFAADDAYIDDGGQRVHIGDIHAVWYRRPLPPIPREDLTPQDAKFVMMESAHLIQSLYRLLDNAFWVNPHLNVIAANSKPYQLRIAKELGFRIPRTLMTNDPSEIMRFYDACDGNLIYKCFISHGRFVDGQPKAVFTTALSKQVVEDNLERVCLAPCTFQERIPKAVELRVSVMGDVMFTAQLASQEQEHTMVDWRIPSPEYGVSDLPHSLVSLDPRVEDQIRSLMKRLGFVYGALDLIVTPDGETVFLEINPNGQWFRIEELTGAPMAETFATLLATGSSR